MSNKYCQECGSKLIEKELEDEGIIPYCPTCNEYRFFQYNIAVSMIVINEENGKILLIKQYNKNSFILVAGYVNRGESLESAVAREIKEETSMLVSRISFNRSKFFQPSNTLMCNFIAFVKNDRQLKVNKEIDYYEWFDENEARTNIKANSLAEEFLLSYLDN